MARTYLERMLDEQARRCPACGKFFMAQSQRKHHDANAARLCDGTKPGSNRAVMEMR